MDTSETDLRKAVKERYGAAAARVKSGGKTSCCGPSCCSSGDTAEADPISRDLYDDSEKASLPADAVAASLGCGNPTALATLREGDVVLDLGSGGGIDVLLSAQRVGPTGHAIGLDMTDEMLELARRNAAEAGATNVEFVKGTIETIPLDAATVDVVISNCVINLAADKPAVFREIARVLRPNGRVGVSDIVADDRLTAADREARGSYAGCIAGALSFGEYADGLAGAGLVDVEITATHAVGDGMYGAIVRARRPAVGEAATAARAPRIDASLQAARALPIVQAEGCC
jgi:SAM-dependent methyltransferase